VPKAERPERDIEAVNKIFMMNRIFIVGGTGYIGKYFAKASVSQGYPTFVLVHPARAAAPDSSKDKSLQELKDNGIHIC
jgi:nucleoside-diphosphate-sugar epimerase